jgi:hypothetical protein
MRVDFAPTEYTTPSADYSLAVLALATVLVIREKTGASAQAAGLLVIGAPSDVRNLNRTPRKAVCN